MSFPIVAEHCQKDPMQMMKTENDQVVNAQVALKEILPPTHTPDGKFAKGNSLSSLRVNTGKGFAIISSRVEHILKTRNAADINFATERGTFETLLGIDAVAYRRAKAAIYGLGQEAADVVDRIDGPVTKRTEISGPDGTPIEIQSTNVDVLLLELSSKAVE